MFIWVTTENLDPVVDAIVHWASFWSCPLGDEEVRAAIKADRPFVVRDEATKNALQAQLALLGGVVSSQNQPRIMLMPGE